MDMTFGTSDVRSFWRTGKLKHLVGIQYVRWLKRDIYPAEDSVGVGMLIITWLYS
jgi:hypothetical protein